jgi:hypothetical protein
METYDGGWRDERETEYHAVHQLAEPFAGHDCARIDLGWITWETILHNWREDISREYHQTLHVYSARTVFIMGLRTINARATIIVARIVKGEPVKAFITNNTQAGDVKIRRELNPADKAATNEMETTRPR